jgi:hypothetical protein
VRSPDFCKDVLAQSDDLTVPEPCGLIAMVLIRNHFLAISLVAGVLGTPISAFGGTSCGVPAEFPTLESALETPACTTIVLEAGRYRGQTITRSVAVTGAGPASTIIEGSIANPALRADGSGVLVTLQGVRLESGNGNEAVFQTSNGAEIAFALDILVGRGQPVFGDGFEGN